MKLAFYFRANILDFLFFLISYIIFRSELVIFVTIKHRSFVASKESKKIQQIGNQYWIIILLSISIKLLLRQRKRRIKESSQSFRSWTS